MNNTVNDLCHEIKFENRVKHRNNYFIKQNMSFPFLNNVLKYIKYKMILLFLEKYFLRFLRIQLPCHLSTVEVNFECCFVKSGLIKRHFPLITPFTNFTEILIHNLCRKQRIINGREKDVPSANNFAKDCKLSGRSFTYTKKRKGPSIQPCGSPAKIKDQLDD